MSDPAPHPETIVPIKVPEPADHAPPSLAEPASGPVAELSSAVPIEPSTTETTSVAKSTDVNGETQTTESSSEKPTTTADEQPSASTAEPVSLNDISMTDVAEPEGDPKSSVEAIAGTSNGTSEPAPAPTPASSSKPKRKSSVGVPEHKSKTLKKKQSKAKITHLDAKPGDFFLARLRSYPPWPSIICDEEMLPEVLLGTRPVTAKQSDGTFKEPYVDGGKKVGDRTFPVMFLHTNEFGWIPNTDLSELDLKTCKDVSEKGKTKQLLKAYEVASEEHDLQHFKDMLLQHEAALQQDEDEKAAKAAEKASKSEKKKRKSEVKADEDVEMDDVDATPAKPSKKRKKEPETDEDEPEKAAKTPKTTKLKLTTKTPQTTEKKPKEKATKPKSEKKKKPAQESEEEVEPEKEEAPPLDPVEARKARDKEVLFLRHKLQKGFLSRDTEPQEDEMPQMATYFKKLEAYDDKLEVSIIRNTKINKVLKGIIKLNSIPKDEEYNFRERSVKLLGIWNQLLGAEPADSDKPSKDEKKDSPTTTNGVHKEAEEKAGEKIEPEVTEPKENTISNEEAVDKVSAEVAVDAGEKAAAIDAIEKDEKPAEDKEVAPTPAAVPVSAPATVPATEDKAPASATAAAEATEVVKATE